jgi:glycosyltransferase involved in cell wall biosynthesis
VEDIHVAFVGRLVAQKRPELYLEVLAELARRGIGVRGTMIGEGPLRERTEAEAEGLGLAVTFVGWHEPWWTAVEDVSCLLLTARFEGLANVLIEAAAVEIPSVASSRALGIADAIVPGLTGELSMTDDAVSYADAVMRACSRVGSSRSPVATWLQRFSTEESTARLLLALRDAADRSI